MIFHFRCGVQRLLLRKHVGIVILCSEAAYDPHPNQGFVVFPEQTMLHRIGNDKNEV